MDTNIVHNLDCQFADRFVEKESVDLVLFSPPYANLREYGHENSQCHPDKYVEWFMPKAQVFFDILNKNGSMIININDCVVDGFRHPYVYELVLALQKQIGFKMFERCFWDKGKTPPTNNRFRDASEYVFWFVKDKNFKHYMDEGRIPYQPSTIERYKKPIVERHTRKPGKEGKESKKILDLNPLGALPSTIIKIGSESKNTGTHTAVFPIKFAEYFIKMSTDPGDLVLDPFMGNGTTAIACIKNNRKYIGFEIVEENWEKSLERIEKFKYKMIVGEKEFVDERGLF